MKQLNRLDTRLVAGGEAQKLSYIDMASIAVGSYAGFSMGEIIGPSLYSTISYTPATGVVTSTASALFYLPAFTLMGAAFALVLGRELQNVYYSLT